MNSIHYIDEKTRIKVKRYYVSLFGKCYCLQRKGKYFWHTTSWNYVTLLCERNPEYIIYWLKWAEEKEHTACYEPMEKFKELNK